MPPLPLKYDAKGLVPVIIQDHLTGQIRMFAYASDAAVRKTLETGVATFWSRSRAELWQRGRVSGQETPVVRVLADCDGDCIVYSSDPLSPSCNSGAPSCFFQAFDGQSLAQSSERPQTLLASLEASLEPPREAGGPRSSSPAAAEAMAGRAAELCAHATGLAQALEKESDERVVEEAAKTLYQLVAGLKARSISVRRVLAEVADRL